MQKKIFERINLTCVFQNTNNFGSAVNADGSKVSGSTSSNNVVVNGMISTNGDGQILFQETLPRRRDIRNNRLYEGQLVNIVRRKDGLYYPFMKAFNPAEVTDKASFAFKVYQEISEALNSID